jgi:osmotically-inducible protein OsmY
MCIDRLLIGAVLFLSAGASAQAGQNRIDGDAGRDVRQTMEARKLLADEPELEAYNIGVTVQNRVATLWGPVPSIEVAFRAELVLRTMFELTAVRNELFVSELVEPMKKKPLRIDNPPRLLPDLTPPKLPALPRLLPGAPGVLMGTENKRPMSQPTAKEKPMPVLPRIEATIPAPAPVVDGDTQLTSAVRNLLAANAAYRQVQFIVKDGRVYLRTTGPDLDALHEAARAVARLPNVAGVVLVEQDSPR